MHRQIRGATYSARDPELSLWVHATLVDSTMVAYDAWLEPLSRARRAAFYDETRPVARAFGVPDALLPPDVDAFDRYLEAMLALGGPVQVSDTARELGRAVLHPPLAPLAAWLPGGPTLRPWLARIPAATYAWTLWPAIGLLPDPVRNGYGLDWGPRQRIVSGWLVAGWRAWRPLLPEGLRQMPAARAADQRIATDD
jgi:uncharacterized protein (DUF2236 family)